MVGRTSLFGRAVDALEVAALRVERNGNISRANDAAHHLLGAPAGALAGCTIERLVAPERKGELKNIQDVLEGGGQRKVRTVVRREDGSRLSATMIVEPYLDRAGRVVAADVRYEGIGLARPASGQTQPPADSRIRLSRPSDSVDGGPRAIFTDRPIEARFSPAGAVVRASAKLMGARRHLGHIQRFLDGEDEASFGTPEQRARILQELEQVRQLVDDSLEDLKKVRDHTSGGATDLSNVD